MKIRLQRILAQAGYGSRRKCEEIIQQGRVTLNGTPAALGMVADPINDSILVDGKPIRSPEEKQYLMLYKPRGVLSTVSSPDPRPTVSSIIDFPTRLYPVGRLDHDSEGLILMTNDGHLTNQLTHPRYQHEKEYRILVNRKPNDQQLNGWRKGLILEDGTVTGPAQVWIEHNDENGCWLGVILKEGKKRQLRRMAEVSGLKVFRLIRTRIANLVLDELLPGEWRELKSEEIDNLRKIIDNWDDDGKKQQTKQS